MKLSTFAIHLGVLAAVEAWIISAPTDDGFVRLRVPRIATAWLFCAADDVGESTSKTPKPARPPLRRPIRSTVNKKQSNTLVSSINRREEGALTAHEQAQQDPSLLSSTNVTDLIESPVLLRALREMGIRQFTRVQQQTYSHIRQGTSLCARSKTGSGKSFAFLLPILDQLLSSSLTTKDKLVLAGTSGKTNPSLSESDISVLILVPTRELGLQISEQIKALLIHRPDALTVMGLSGGSTSLGMDRRMLSNIKDLPDVVVATPGRLVDLITERSGSTTRVRGRKLSDILGGTRVVVLDEADRLLLEGFQKEVTRILTVLPRAEKRQTLLFSATVPDKMSATMNLILPKDFVQVDCVEDGDKSDRIRRSYLQIPSMAFYTSSLVTILKQEMQRSGGRYKILVFFPTARLVRFYAELYNVAFELPVREIHSRMSQSMRNKARAAFSHARECVMFTSDVSARGIDYPDVTLVIQYGAPFNVNLDTHRVGRTARAGREGSALLVTLPFETKSPASFARKFGYTKINVDYDFDELEDTLTRARQAVSRHKGLRSNAENALISFIAYYAEYGPKFLDSRALTDAAESLAYEIGIGQLPDLPERLRLSLDERRSN